MLDFSFSELLLIAVVAVVCLGPKELPVAVRAVARVAAQLRMLTAEFHGAFQALAREAGADEVRNVTNIQKVTLGDDGKPYEAYDLDAFLKSTPVITPPDDGKPGSHD